MYKGKDHLLFCPGPVNIASNVWQSLVRHIGHREQEFSDLMDSLHTKLLKVYEIKNTKKYYPVILTGSGTAVNEMVLSSIVGNKHILVLTNGEFGERLHKISSLHNKHTHVLSFPWAKEIDIRKVDMYLKKHSIEVIAMVYHETSTGMLNPVSKIGKLAKKYKAQFFVDTVSSAPLEKINLEESHVTFCSTSSGKALGSLPGLGIVIGEKKAFEDLKSIPAKVIYLNLYNLYHFSREYKQTPNTPAVQLFYALDQSLTNILDLGITTWRKTIRQRAQVLRIGMKKLQLEFLLEEKQMSSLLTTVVAPSTISLVELKQKLKEKHIIIYNGKGPLTNKVFQVGNIGDISESNIHYFLHCLENILSVSRLHKNKDNLLWKKFSHYLHLPLVNPYIKNQSNI